MTNRVGIVSSLRVPFVKADTLYKDSSAVELGAHVLKALIQKVGVQPELIVMGEVLLNPRTPNWTREMLFKAHLDKNIYCESVSNNCISGLVAISRVRERILEGAITHGIGGGVEFMSLPSFLFKDQTSRKFIELSKTRDFKSKLSALLRFKFNDFLPEAPSVKEPSTGLTMGEHMEITAKELKIKREIQDQIAFNSHQNAAKAQKDGLFNDLISPFKNIVNDSLIRSDTSIEKLSKLKPVFDRTSGTLTAGNSSPLTDGASAVYLMSEAEVARRGIQPLAWIVADEYSAVDPAKGLLMAPGKCVPNLLKRNNLKLEDFDLIEVHEAFAAQVEANIQSWEKGLMADPIGTIDRSKLNLLGGSIALGHPFSATGGRIVGALAQELKRKNLDRGLISICAAGGMAGAMIIERA